MNNPQNIPPDRIVSAQSLTVAYFRFLVVLLVFVSAAIVLVCIGKIPMSACGPIILGYLIAREIATLAYSWRTARIAPGLMRIDYWRILAKWAVILTFVALYAMSP